MNTRVIQAMQIMALFFSVSLYANHNGVIDLYPGNGYSNTSLSTFPEVPEWNANWGNKGGLEPPYIRFSGQKNQDSDWETKLHFEKLPVVTEAGDSLSITVFVTENLDIELSLGENSQKVLVSLQGGKAKEIKLPIEKFFNTLPQKISTLNVKLVNVPGWHYVTLLLGKISIQSKGNFSSPGETETVLQVETEEFLLSKTEFSKPSRIHLENLFNPPYSRGGYSKEKRDSLKVFSSSKIFLEESDDLQFSALVENNTNANFIQKLYLLSRNSIQDSVLANPRTLWRDGKQLAAANDYSLLPILAADIEYEAAECNSLAGDSTCANYGVVKKHFLGAAPITDYVYGSKIQIVLDPYFFLTNRKGELPFELEISLAGKNYQLNGASVVDVEFPQLGFFEMIIRVRRAGKQTEWKYLVEVK